MTRYAVGTEVTTDRSRAEIERTLQRYGATSFAYGWDRTSAVVQFDHDDRRVRFTLPLPDRADFATTPTGKARAEAATHGAWEQACRQRWRALALAIKAKLEAVESGISTFEQEFLAFVVLPNGQAFGEWAAPQIARAYEANTMPALLVGASA